MQNTQMRKRNGIIPAAIIIIMMAVVIAVLGTMLLRSPAQETAQAEERTGGMAYEANVIPVKIK